MRRIRVYHYYDTKHQLSKNIVAIVPSIPDQSRAHTHIYIKLPYFISFLFLRRLLGLGLGLVLVLFFIAFFLSDVC